MKNFLRHLPTALALTTLCISCSSESTDVPEAADPIRFATEIAWPTDRAATDKTTFGNGDEIGVFAYYQSNATPNFMNNQLLSYTSGWTYAPVKYWPNNTDATLDFYAYSPYRANIAMSTKGSLSCQQTAPSTGATITPSSEISTGSYALDGDTDFLIAALPSQGKPAVGQAITFHFYHTLAKVRLTFAIGSGLTAATINSVSFCSVPTKGSVSVNGSDITWNNIDSYGTYTRTLASPQSVTSGEAQNITEFDTYLIPCTLSQLSITGTAEDGNRTSTFTKEVTTINVTLQAGNTTTLNITLTPDVMTP